MLHLLLRRFELFLKYVMHPRCFFSTRFFLERRLFKIRFIKQIKQIECAHDLRPKHFDSLVANFTKVWADNACSPETLHTCLPNAMVSVRVGSWFARGMYSRYLQAWLGSLTCEQVHLVDITRQPLDMVQRLFEFMDVSDEAAAKRVTDHAYHASKGRRLSQNKHAESEEFLNSRSYNGVMLNETRSRLQTFYEPYQQELCSMMERQPQCHSLRIPLFMSGCLAMQQREE